MSLNRRANLLAVVLCGLFLAVSLPWITRLGIQTDEAIFAGGIYPPFAGQFIVRIFKHDVPLMVMSYVGSLKSLIWRMIFFLWQPSPASVRIPALLLSALCIWLLYRLLAATVGVRAGLAAAALLATDPMYIMYSRYDHGPVVIQHVCQIGSLLALARFYQTGSRRWLASGFFLLGLGIWEKAVFSWILGGFLVAAAAVFWREIGQKLSGRNARVAVLALVVGSSPLLLYNVRHSFETFRGNTVWSAEGFSAKAGLLWRTLQGDALFGSMTRDVWEEPFREPANAAERASLALSGATGLRRQSLAGYLAAAAVLLVPLVWRTAARKAFLFALIALAVAWLQMALIKGAGGGAHHTILLWPLPALGTAAVLAASSQRLRFGAVLLAALLAVAVFANLLVLNTYYTCLLRNGGTSSWTDAMYPAFEAIHKQPKEAICTIDWGFFDTVRLFEQGHTTLCAAPDPVDDASRAGALRQIQHPGYIFLTHTAGNETFVGMTGRFLAVAREAGFQVVARQRFRDSNGRETVEVFRFSR